MSLFEPITRQYQTPIWNGEDIIMSLMSMLLYKKPAIICRNRDVFPYTVCKTPTDTKVAIHNNPNHVSHRTRLLRYAIRNFFSGISNDFIYGFSTPRPMFNSTE